MHSNAKPATDAEKKRFELIDQIGCIACRIYKLTKPFPAEIHHLLDGGVRIGHSATIGLCPWHHRGVSTSIGMTMVSCEQMYGPSLVQGSKRFKEVYGSNDDLLKLQNELIETLYRQSKV